MANPPPAHPVPWTDDELLLLSTLKNDFSYLFTEQLRNGDLRYEAWMDVSNSMRAIGGYERSAQACEQMYQHLKSVGCHNDVQHVHHYDLSEDHIPTYKKSKWTAAEEKALKLMGWHLWSDARSKSKGDPEFWIELAIRLKRLNVEFTFTQVRMKFRSFGEVGNALDGYTRETYNTLFRIPTEILPGHYHHVNRVHPHAAQQLPTAPDRPILNLVSTRQPSQEVNRLDYEVVFPSRFCDTKIKVLLPSSSAGGGLPYDISFTFKEGGASGGGP